MSDGKRNSSLPPSQFLSGFTGFLNDFAFLPSSRDQGCCAATIIYARYRKLSFYPVYAVFECEFDVAPTRIRPSNWRANNTRAHTVRPSRALIFHSKNIRWFNRPPDLALSPKRTRARVTRFVNYGDGRSSATRIRENTRIEEKIKTHSLSLRTIADRGVNEERNFAFRDPPRDGRLPKSLTEYDKFRLPCQTRRERVPDPRAGPENGVARLKGK